MRVSQLAVGLVIAWFFFFVAGSCLLKIPSAYHEGTFWQVEWLDKK